MTPAWIAECREGRNAARAGLLDEPMLQACGEIAGAKVVDCGCGEGRFSRMLLARQLPSARDEYHVADVQDLSFLQHRSFDLAVSYLNQCDLLDWEANTREVHRVLKRGGRLIVANLHPMRSAVGSWQPGGDGGAGPTSSFSFSKKIAS